MEQEKAIETQRARPLLLFPSWRWLAWLGFACLVLLSIAGTLLILTPTYSYIYNVLTIIYALLLAGVCTRKLLTLTRANIANRFSKRFSPLLLGISLCVLASAHLSFIIYYIIHRQEPPFPSWPYTIIFGIYPCFIGAVLLLPSRSISLTTSLRIFLDSLMIIIAFATLCLYFVLGPLLMQSDETLFEKTVGTLFPVADLVILFCLLLVTLRSEEPQLRPVLSVLGLAFACFFVIHVGRLLEVLNNTLHWEMELTIAWIPAMALLVLAAEMIKALLKQEMFPTSLNTTDTPVPISFLAGSYWKLFFVSGLILTAVLLTVCLRLFGIGQLFHGQISILCMGGFAILMLLVLRQLLSMYEISVLQSRLQRRNRSLSLLNSMLAQQATTDALTGLPNHRELLARLSEALKQAQESAAPCAILFIDLDYFKAINDTHGHLIGDAVLYEFSELVLTQLGQCACLGRWGGEEFVSVLPGLGHKEAFLLAERLRRAIEEHAFIEEQPIHLTCSIGVATYPCDATRYETLLINADRAMYTAKRLGRNQVRCASEPLVLAMGMLGEEPETAREAELLAVVESFITALEARDSLTGQHSRRVAALSLKLALSLGLSWPESCIIGMGGLLHDLGKVAMPDTILFKRGKLSEAEIEYIARHPLIGEEILAPLPSLRAVAEIVRTHHEWVNGSGYPDGLRGESIPLGARIVAVADAYDAIISHRVYRQGRGASEAAREISKGAGKQFDPRVVEALEYLLATTPRQLLSSIA